MSKRLPRLDSESALAKGVAQEIEFGDVDGVRLTEDVAQALRGTVIIHDQVIHGYPGIGRMLSLRHGLSEQFKGPVWLEEKVDGYNVRVFRSDDRILAVSRGGFICPFTTDRLADLFDTAIFDDHPDLVVCGEVAGPGNPYVESIPKFIGDDIAFFGFDLMRQGQRRFLPRDEFYRLADVYGLPTVRRFGRHPVDALETIGEILRTLNEEGREGLVFKEDTREQQRAKYVTSNANLSDIRGTVLEILDLPSEYFTNRIVRLVTFLHEQGLAADPGLERKLGSAFLDRLREAIGQFESDGKVYRPYRCRFYRKDNAEAFFAHLKSVGGARLHLRWRSLSRQDNYWVLEYEREYAGLTGLMNSLYGGDVIFD